MKSKQLALRTYSMAIIFSLLLVFIVSACNSSGEKKETITNDTTKTATTEQTGLNEGAVSATDAANINYPIFKVDKTQLTGVHGKKPSKVIIKFKHANLSNAVGSVTLLFYAAKSHNDYATNDDPREISDRSFGTKSIPKDLVLGNNELDFKKLLKQNGDLEDFSYLTLTPDILTDAQGRKHLIFKVEGVDSKNEKIRASYLDDLLTKPSPPAPPIGD